MTPRSSTRFDGGAYRQLSSPEFLLLALNRRGGERMSRQLLGVKQPPPWRRRAAVIDPKRHFAATNYRTAKGLLDHLVGARKQRRRHGEAEHPSGLGVDDEFELG